MSKKMTRMQLWKAILIGTMVFSDHSASAQTLSEAVDQTVKSNPEVLIDAKRRLEQDYSVKIAQAGYYPKVDATLGIGREQSDNITTNPGKDTLTRRESSLTLSQMLYDGYAVKSSVDRNQSLVESAAHRVANTSERMGLRAVEVFLGVLRHQELLALAQANLEVHERTFEQIKLRSDSGVGRKADMEQAQARLSLAQANLAATQGNLREAQINFLRVVGNSPGGMDKPVDLSCELFPGTLDDAVNMSFSNNPALSSSIAEYEAALAEEQRAKSALKPRADLDLGTSWNRNPDGVKFRDDDESAMLHLRYNIYRGGADTARIAQTQYQSQQAKEVVQRTKRDIEESTRTSWNALETAKARLPKQKAHTEAAELTRQAYAKQFSIGQRTLLDLLDSENELYTARSQYVNGQYEERFAFYRLLADMGKLLKTLGVAPREESRTAALP